MSPPSLFQAFFPRPLPLSAAASSLLDPGRSRNAAPYLPKEEEDDDAADRAAGLPDLDLLLLASA